MTDWDQLHAYFEKGDQKAFAALVKQHLNLVYSAVLRQVNDRGAAEEIAQSVFVLLVQKGRKLKPTGSLAGWLYNAARLKAKEHLRSEIARKKREQKSHDMNITETADGGGEQPLDWDKVAPFLDDAMEDLAAKDREAVLLRYFKQQPLREVGTALGVSEDAARKRIDRAVEKLRGWFAQRGVACSSVTLVAGLSSYAVQSAPAHLAEATVQTALATGAATATTTATTTIITAMASAKATLIAAVLVGAAVPLSMGYLGQPQPETAKAATPTIEEFALEIPSAERSGLIREWEKLLAEHGPNGGGSMGAVYQIVKDIKDPFRRRVFRTVLVGEWTQSDPAGAFAFFKKEDKWLVSGILEDWLAADQEGAIATMRANAGEISGEIGGLLDDVARLSPDDLPDLASHVEKGRWDDRVRDAFAIIADGDPDRAIRLANQVSDKKDARKSALAGVAKGWAQTDGAAALAWVEELPKEQQDGELMRSLLTGWAKTDPAGALDRLDLAPPGGRENYFADSTAAHVMKVVGEHHYEDALAWMAKNPGRLDRDGLMGLQKFFGARFHDDVEGTLAMAAQHPASQDLLEVLNSVLMNQGGIHRDRVWEWLKEQPDSAFKSDLSYKVFMTDASQSPESAIAKLDEFKPAGGKDNRDIAWRILGTGRNFQYLDEILEKASPELRPKLIDAAIDTVASQGLSIEPLLARMDEFTPQQRRRATGSIATRWGETDPMGAIEWAQSLRGEEKSEATKRAVQAWARNESYEASEWVSQQAAGAQRDSSIRGLVNGIANDEPEAAWRWAKDIGDPIGKMETLSGLAMTVGRQDPAKAASLIEDADITPGHRGMLKMQLEANGIKLP